MAPAERRTLIGLFGLCLGQGKPVASAPPEISHSLTVPSPAEARFRPSAENATEQMQPLWACHELRTRHDSSSQSVRLPRLSPAAKQAPSGEKSTETAKSDNPRRQDNSRPVAESQSRMIVSWLMAVASLFPSGEKSHAMHGGSHNPQGAGMTHRAWPVTPSQHRIVPRLPDTRVRLSGANATAVTVLVWPASRAFCRWVALSTEVDASVAASCRQGHAIV